MSNGEIAIVVETNKEKKIKTKVILLLDEEENPDANVWLIVKNGFRCKRSGYHVTKMSKAE